MCIRDRSRTEKLGLPVQDPPDVAASEAAPAEKVAGFTGVLHLTDNGSERDFLFQAIDKLLDEHGAQSETAERREDLNPLEGPFSGEPVGFSDAKSDRALFLAVDDPQPGARGEDRTLRPHCDLVGAWRRSVVAGMQDGGNQRQFGRRVNLTDGVAGDLGAQWQLTAGVDKAEESLLTVEPWSKRSHEVVVDVHGGYPIQLDRRSFQRVLRSCAIDEQLTGFTKFD